MIQRNLGNTELLQVLVAPEIKQRLAEIAAERRMSVSQLIREYLSQLVSQNTPTSTAA